MSNGYAFLQIFSLRYKWHLKLLENQGLIKVARDSGGRREYEENDIEWIKFIRRLKETGMHLRDIQKYSELRYCGKSTMPERMKILEAHRKYVLEQRQKWNEYLQNLEIILLIIKEVMYENSNHI